VGGGSGRLHLQNVKKKREGTQVVQKKRGENMAQLERGKNYKGGEREGCGPPTECSPGRGRDLIAGG